MWDRDTCRCPQYRHVLALTSLVFLWPWVALRRRAEHALVARATLALVITSVLYHATHHPALRLVDLVAVRTALLLGMLCLAEGGCARPRVGAACAALVVAIYTLPAFRASDGRLRVDCHVAMHACGAAALLALGA